MPETELGYYSKSLGWIDQATNAPGGVFSITSDLNMAGYSIDNADNGSFAGDLTSTEVKTGSIQEKDNITDILPILSQIATTSHVEVTNSGGAIILAANAVIDGLLIFNTTAVTSLTWPDYNQIDALLSVKNSGGSNKYSSFYTVISNQDTVNDLPPAQIGTGQSFEGSGGNVPIKAGMVHVYKSIVGAGFYNTYPVAVSFNSATGDYSIFGDYLTEGGNVDSTGGNDLNLGSKTSTGDVNIGQSGQNIAIQGDNLKVNSITPNGAGPIFIDGEALQVYSPGNDIHCNVGWVAGSPPTDEAVLHVEGNGNTGILVDGGHDGTGSSYLEIRGETRSIAASVDVDATTDNVIISASSQTSKAQNDIIFKVGGQYASDPGLDNRVTPAGGVEALKIDGANQNVEIANQLILNSTGEPQILSNNVGLCWGTAGSSAGAGRFHNVVIGEDCTALNGDNNVAIGLRAICGGITGVALGSDAVTTASQSTVSIGWSANVSQSQGTAVGPNSDVSGANASAYGFNSSAGGTSSVAIGTSAVTQNNNSIAIGPFTSANGVAALAIGNASSATGTNAVSICGGANSVPNSALLFDDTYAVEIAGSLKKGVANDVWSNTVAPVVDTGTLYTQNAVSYTLGAEEIVNAIVRNTYGAGVSTVTFPTYTQVVNYLENAVTGTPTAGAQTRHTIFETTFINTTAQTVTLTAGTGQIAIGNSLSAGIPAESCVSFKHYLSNTFVITVRTSTESLV